MSISIDAMLNCQKHSREPGILPGNIACYRSYRSCRSCRSCCVRSRHRFLCPELPRQKAASNSFIHSRIKSTININRSAAHLDGAMPCPPARFGSGSRCPRRFQRRCSRCGAGGSACGWRKSPPCPTPSWALSSFPTNCRPPRPPPPRAQAFWTLTSSPMIRWGRR